MKLHTFIVIVDRKKAPTQIVLLYIRKSSPEQCEMLRQTIKGFDVPENRNKNDEIKLKSCAVDFVQSFRILIGIKTNI